MGAETFYNRWTRQVPNDAGRELRPWHHRALASFVLFVSGTSLAVLFIHGRSCIIKRADGIFFPVSSSSQMELRYIALKSFGAVGPRHSLVPKEQCEIVPTKHKHELKLRVHGESTYWLGLDHARINGEEVPGPEAAYARLVQVLGLGPAAGRWRGGPIVSRRDGKASSK